MFYNLLSKSQFWFSDVSQGCGLLKGSVSLPVVQCIFPFPAILALAKAFPFCFLEALSPVDCFGPLDETRKLDGTGGIEKSEKIFNFLRKAFSNVYHENLVAF